MTEEQDVDDFLSWSWDELTGGEREEATDDEVAAIALFAGVPDDEVEDVKRQYEELFNGVSD